MKLYYSPGACSLSPHIVLKEAGIPCEIERVNLQEHKTEHGADFYATTLKGQVPTLVLDDGTVLTEGVVIVQYLADQRPQSNLAPAATSFERYQLQSWLNFIGTELHKGFSPLFRPTTPEEYKTIARDTLTKKFAILDAQLGKNQFVAGGSFTVADAYCYTILRWADRVNLDLSAFKNVVAYKARIDAREGVQQALKAEGLI